MSAWRIPQYVHGFYMWLCSLFACMLRWQSLIKSENVTLLYAKKIYWYNWNIESLNKTLFLVQTLYYAEGKKVCLLMTPNWEVLLTLEQQEPLERNLDRLEQFWAPQLKRDFKIFEYMQRTATKLMKKQKNVSCEEWLSPDWACPFWRKRGWKLTSFLSVDSWGEVEMNVLTLLWNPVIRQVGMVQNCDGGFQTGY